MTTNIVLVPGFWLGAWAWDAVLPHLDRAAVTASALTLPGLESIDSPRADVTFDQHVDAIVTAITDTDDRTVLVVHSGAGPIGYAVTDRIPDRIARIVYVDTGPVPHGQALRPDLTDADTDIPLPSWAELEAQGNSLAGLDEDALTTFRTRAVPHPAGPARTPLVLTNPARYEVPTTAICASMPSSMLTELAANGHPLAAEIAKLPVTYVDVPTGHWPMWSAPAALAEAILGAADS